MMAGEPLSARARKQEIRESVWARLDAEGLSTFPRPVRGRIPNVRGADAAAERLAQTPEWRAARVVKVNPDAPQRPVRYRALKEGKVLLMPTPRLREGFLRVDPSGLRPAQLFAASSIGGAFELGDRVGLDDLPAIDLLVSGSVAVSADGDRVGKGEGYAELEFATLRELGRVSADVTIATTVHDAQVVEAIPRELFDVTLDIICTPSRTIRPAARAARPPGILWDALASERLEEMPILAELKSKTRDMRPPPPGVAMMDERAHSRSPRARASLSATG
ncbi:MAG TPA: 5-formyltetrahydrofolate cyclo-ligase [Chloroflexota bacterium]|nr:5-formyltetrahydrofolate cyclo-ligase [Chloroflexota bacterium]